MQIFTYQTIDYSYAITSNFAFLLNVVSLYISAHFCHQEKLVQEVMARQMPQPKMGNQLGGAIYPGGFVMPIYAPPATAMSPIMHIIRPQQQVAPPPSMVPPEESGSSSYVQQLQSE